MHKRGSELVVQELLHNTPSYIIKRCQQQALNVLFYKELKTYDGCDDNYVTSEYPFKNHASVRNVSHSFFSNKVTTISKGSYCNRIYRIHGIARKVNRRWKNK